MPAIVIARGVPAFAAVCAVALSAAPATASPITFSFTRIFDESTPVPNDLGVTLESFDDVAVDDQGNVVVNANTTAPSGPGDENVIAQINGSTVVIGSEGRTLPGSTEVLGNLDDHVEIRDGTVAFFQSSSPDAILLGDGTTTRVVAREGETPIPFGGGTTTDYDLRNSEGFGFDGTRTAFQAESFDGDFSTDGVFVEDGAGTITKILDTTDTPDAALGTTYTEFNNPMPDADGPGIAFEAEVDGGSGGSRTGTDALFLFDGGLTLIDSFTGSEGEIQEFDIDAGQILYGVEVGGVNSYRLFDGSAISTVVSEGDLLPNGEVIDSLSLSGDFGIANGVVGFFAQSASGSSFNLWLDGMITTLLTEGDMLDGEVVEALSGASVGTLNRPFLADGFAAFEVRFDGEDTIYRAQFTPTAVAPIPLPAAVWMLLAGFGTLGIIARRRTV
ncbi:MAG: VPLPA-CTERM sorting domain-containing protein [Pseudomonadota bacterium]